MNDHLIQWLLDSDEPWTRYRTRVDLLDQSEEDAEVQASRAEMLAHPQVQTMAAEATTWGDRPLKRHNDAGHPIYKFSTLADFGVRASDAGVLDGLGEGLEALRAHQSPEGAFQTVLNIAPRYGGTGEDTWTWLPCDAPTLLYSLLAMGAQDSPELGDSKALQRAVEHLVSTVDDNGWRCAGGQEVGKFRGPGRKADPCPMANVYALKALAQVPEWVEGAAERTKAERLGAEMLLWHWEHQTERKIYLFGIGTDYRRLKYPFVWYNVLHVVDVLSRFPTVHSDPRFGEMVETIAAQADGDGRFTASSMYRTWKGWSFADKKQPSPWLTFLCCRVAKRVHGS